MKVLVLGAGAVGTVSALRFARRPIFSQVVIADTVPGRAQALAARIDRPHVRGFTLDASQEASIVQAIRETGTTLVLNSALPATNLVVMRACLAAGVDYIDLASGGTEADGIPKLEDQFALEADYLSRGRLALLGMGADPGTSNVYAAHIAKHLLEEVTAFHVRDGDNSVCEGPGGMVAAFSPWVFIDECLCPPTIYQDGRWGFAEPLSGEERFDFPELGKLTCYHVDHEETKTLPRFFGRVKNADFKFTLAEDTIATLSVLHQLGLSKKSPIKVDGLEIIPRNLVVALMPKPADLAGKLRGRSCVGTLGKGYQNDELKAFYVYSIADHERAYDEMRVQATAYQTGIPPVVAAELIAEGEWRGAGVMSPEQFDPDPFLDRLPAAGMPWEVRQMPVERPAKDRLRVLAA